MNLPIIRLIYASQATTLMKPQDEWSILETARTANPKLDITGLLTFDEQYFCQYLEGPRDAVTSLFLKIALDRRHERIQLLDVSPIEARLFGQWSMAFAPREEAFAPVYQAHFGQGQFNPFLLSDQGADFFFRALKEQLALA
ncbi:MAG: BLUF domain-containing protein [bacterium]|nr:BLUF domain-containing protein [bacterium]